MKKLDDQTMPSDVSNSALALEIRQRLKARNGTDGPAYLKPLKISGHKLSLRDATMADAAFIVDLRTNEQKARYISRTSADVAQQEQWLAKYALDDSQIYFIIQDAAGESVGTVRLYDQQADSFCWGSWILKPGAASSSALESALMVYHFALALGFRQAHFEVRKANESVWKFHERFGAKRISETEEDIHYSIAEAEIHASLGRYSKFLPRGISVEF